MNNRYGKGGQINGKAIKKKDDFKAIHTASAHWIMNDSHLLLCSSQKKRENGEQKLPQNLLVPALSVMLWCLYIIFKLEVFWN